MTINVSGILQFADKVLCIILVDPRNSLVRWEAQVIILILQKLEFGEEKPIGASSPMFHQHKNVVMSPKPVLTSSPPLSRGHLGLHNHSASPKGKGLPQHFPGEMVTTIKSPK